MLLQFKNLIRNINYLTKHSLWDQREEDIAFLTNKIVDDVGYEYGLNYPGKRLLTILDAEKSMELIVNSGKSFIRTGDGEVNLMRGRDHAFLKYNKKVADILINALEQPRDNLLVGINRNYFIPLAPLGKYTGYYRRHAYELRSFYLEHCNSDMTYLDSTCTSYKESETDTDSAYSHYDRWRKMFQGKDIVIVCGEGVLDNLKYDVFEYANTKEFIYGPKVNAWDKHDELMSQIIENVSKDKLLVFILGQSGKAMIVELADMGYTCWDVGHLAKYYNAYKTGMVWTPENRAKFYAPD